MSHLSIGIGLEYDPAQTTPEKILKRVEELLDTVNKPDMCPGFEAEGASVELMGSSIDPETPKTPEKRPALLVPNDIKPAGMTETRVYVVVCEPGKRPHVFQSAHLHLDVPNATSPAIAAQLTVESVRKEVQESEQHMTAVLSRLFAMPPSA